MTEKVFEIHTEGKSSFLPAYPGGLYYRATLVSLGHHIIIAVSYLDYG